MAKRISKSSMRARMKRIRSFRGKKSATRVKRVSISRKPMARRRTRRAVRRVGRGLRSIGKARGKFGNFLRQGLVGDAASALGAGLIVSAVTNRVMPSITPFAAIGGAYLAGGIKGAVVAELIKPMIGMPSILPSIMGGFGGLFGQSSNTQMVESV